MKLESNVAVVTGGTGTIGEVIGTALREAGALVVRWDRDAGDGSEPDLIAVDVSSSESVEAAMDLTVQRFGVPRVLINAAGLSGGLATLATEAVHSGDWSGVLSPESAWQQTFSVNVLGPVNTIRAFARVVGEQDSTEATDDGGSVVNISSTSGGPIVDPALSAYSASKAAVNMITRLAASDLGPLGIRVNAVAPGFMETRMKPMPGPAVTSAAPDRPTATVDTGARVASQTPYRGRLGRPEDIAEAVLAVLASGFVTGQVIHVEGGLTLHSLLRG